MRFMRLLFMRYTLVLKLFLSLFCFSCGMVEVSAATADQSVAETKDIAIIESLLQKAEELQLAEHETWFALLHYKRETCHGDF